MSNNHVTDFLHYTDQMVRETGTWGAYESLRAHPEVVSVYLRRLYLLDIHGRDRVVWPSKEYLVGVTGRSEKSVRRDDATLVELGLMHPGPRPNRGDGQGSGADSDIYHMVDVVAEYEALEAENARLARRIGDEFEEMTVEEVQQAIEKVVDHFKATFEAAHPGHVPTNGRILAMMQGKDVQVFNTRTGNIRLRAKAKARVAHALDGRGVEDPKAAAEALIAAKEEREGKHLTGAAIHAALNAGEFEEELPEVSPVVEMDTPAGWSPVDGAATAHDPAESDRSDTEYAADGLPASWGTPADAQWFLGKAGMSRDETRAYKDANPRPSFVAASAAGTATVVEVPGDDEPVNVDPAWAAAYERAQYSGIAHPVVVRLGSGEWVGVDRGSAIRFHGLGGAGVAAAEAVVRVQQARQDEAA